MKEKDKINILRQPEKSILSIIVMNTEYPLPEKLHNDIETLLTVSDVMLVFSNRYFPSSEGVNKERFSSIYRVTGWIDSSEILPRAIVRVLEYSKEIFSNKHSTFVIFNADSIDLTEKLINNITLSVPLVTRPIFKTVRLTSEQYFDIYKSTVNDFNTEPVAVEERAEKDSNVVKKFLSKTLDFIIKPWKKGKEIIELKKDNHLLRCFSSYTTTTNAFLFKAVTAHNLISFFNDPLKDEYIDSFDWNDFRYCFSSLIKKLNIETVNVNLEDLDLQNDSNRIRLNREEGEKK